MSQGIGRRLGSATRRYRPRRMSAEELDFEADCSFQLGSASVGPLPLIDVSATGLAFEPARDLDLTPGTPLEVLTVLYRDAPVWSGRGVVVYQVATPARRATGASSTSGR